MISAKHTPTMTSPDEGHEGRTRCATLALEGVGVLELVPSWSLSWFLSWFLNQELVPDEKHSVFRSRLDKAILTEKIRCSRLNKSTPRLDKTILIEKTLCSRLDKTGSHIQTPSQAGVPQWLMLHCGNPGPLQNDTSEMNE